MKDTFALVFQILCLVSLPGCATKYLLASNRFITPEGQGGAFRGQIEFLQTSANQLTLDTSNDSVEEGVLYRDVNRSGFLFSSSLFDRFDILWSHAGGGNSMLGGKFQVVGDSRLARSAGHKVGVAALLGGNEHETDDRAIEFELTGREYIVSYGYRFTENVMPYSSASLATYNFIGKIRSSDPLLDGLEPNVVTSSRAFSAGIEFSFEAWLLKIEGTYQQLETEKTKDRERIALGYTLGLSW